MKTKLKEWFPHLSKFQEYNEKEIGLVFVIAFFALIGIFSALLN